MSSSKQISTFHALLHRVLLTNKPIQPMMVELGWIVFSRQFCNSRKVSTNCHVPFEGLAFQNQNSYKLYKKLTAYLNELRTKLNSRNLTLSISWWPLGMLSCFFVKLCFLSQILPVLIFFVELRVLLWIYN